MVHAAAGGTGQLLVQICSRVLGARVIGTTSTAEKAEVARGCGAQEVSNTGKGCVCLLAAPCTWLYLRSHSAHTRQEIPSTREGGDPVLPQAHHRDPPGGVTLASIRSHTCMMHLLAIACGQQSAFLCCQAGACLTACLLPCLPYLIVCVSVCLSLWLPALVCASFCLSAGPCALVSSGSAVHTGGCCAACAGADWRQGGQSGV